MPASVKSFLPGNYIQHPDFSLAEFADMIGPGARVGFYEGYARVTTTTGTSIPIANRMDMPCIIPASASDPTWVQHLSFYIPPYTSTNPNEYGSNTITTSGNQVLKLAIAASADATASTTVTAVSGAATAGVVPSGEFISLIKPHTPVELTTDSTFQLFSSTDPSGTGTAGANIRVATGWLWIPVQVVFTKRMRAPSMSDVLFSDAQLKINADA